MRFAYQTKILAHQRGITLHNDYGLLLPTKKTILDSAPSAIMKSYGISSELISEAQKYFTQLGLLSYGFGLSFDGVFVATDDSFHTATQTRHGFVLTV